MIDSLFLSEAAVTMRRYKELAAEALGQVDDRDFYRQIDPESNSIGVLVKHLAGNMRSRWTDFLTSDLEKPDRDRDGEFVTEEPDDRGALMERWENSWTLAFTTLGSLKPVDLEKPVRLGGQTYSVVGALNRLIGHVTYHVGQIVFLAKHFAGSRWKSPTVPRNKARISTRKT
jgi:hypothetical protein